MANKRHISKEQLITAFEQATSLKEACEILGKTKQSLYTYASEYGVPIRKRWMDGKLRKDGYYHYTNSNNHRRLMEKHLDRSLERHESVHHIDGNKLNNDLNNLVVLTWDEHKKSHISLEECGHELMKLGYIEFDRNTNRYRIK